MHILKHHNGNMIGAYMIHGLAVEVVLIAFLLPFELKLESI